MRNIEMNKKKTFSSRGKQEAIIFSLIFIFLGFLIVKEQYKYRMR